MPSYSSSIVKPIHSPLPSLQLEPNVSFELAHQHSPVPTRNSFAWRHWKIFNGSSTLPSALPCCFILITQLYLVFPGQQAGTMETRAFSFQGSLALQIFGVGSLCKIGFPPRKKTTESSICPFSLVLNSQFLICKLWRQRFIHTDSLYCPFLITPASLGSPCRTMGMCWTWTLPPPSQWPGLSVSSQPAPGRNWCKNPKGKFPPWVILLHTNATPGL